MGSPASEVDRGGDEYQHEVTISNPFYMQTTEVTQGQWKAVLLLAGVRGDAGELWKKAGGDNYKEGPNYPAMYLTWVNAVAFCKILSTKEGKTYRLPTEAEWEYACRAGTQTTWSFGNDEKELGDYAWYAGNTIRNDETYAHQVGLKKPNAFGLYDMHGNVREWCHDYYGEDYYKQSPENDPAGGKGSAFPSSGSNRVLRGGSFYFHPATHTRSARRHKSFPDKGSLPSHGFRVVLEVD
jgi:formylglycine-generating enzyme required for sulfatase activity